MAQNRPATSAEGETFVAIYSFESKKKGDLCFKEGDKFFIIDSKAEHWWKAKCLQTNREGYIPSNYVGKKSKRFLRLPNALASLRVTDKSSDEPSFLPEKLQNSRPPRKLPLPVTHDHTNENTSLPPRPPKPESLRPQPAEIQQPGHIENVYEIPDDVFASPIATDSRLSNSTVIQTPKVDKFDDSSCYDMLKENLRTTSTYEMEERWHFGGITKEQCDLQLYNDQNRNGAFLVRESTSNPGQLCLSVLFESKDQRQPNHYRLKENKDGYLYIKDNVLFKRLGDLVRHYSALEDGLCCKLQKPCPKPKDKSMLWATARDSVKLGNKLGSGNFGKVVKGRLYGFREVAVKSITKEDIKSKKDFMKEADLMKNLIHPNIVRLYGMVYDEPVWIITEYMFYGSLLSYLQSNQKISPQDQNAMCIQIASGMAYLEEKNFIHRDLRADNVLVSGDRICKIADFGLARILVDGIYESKNKVFPVRWTAPEALTHHQFSIKSDVWSYGIVVMEIFTRGAHPYYEMTTNLQVQQQVIMGYRMPKPEDCPQCIHDVTMSCWEKSAAERPSFEDLKKKFESLHF